MNQKPYNINVELGPLFTLKCENNSGPANQESALSLVALPATQVIQLNVGTKSSSLFGTGGGSTVIVSSEGVEITASEPLGAFRAVTHSGYYCDPTEEDLSSYAGVTTVAMVSGSTGVAIRTGLISDSLWTLTPNQSVFISANGILTQTPTALPLRRIGWAVSTTEINLDPFPIILGD